MLAIGELSKQTGVQVTTIRYYESIDLMLAPERTESGQRRYDDAALERLRFIRHARDLGFPIDSIRELIQLQTAPGQDCHVADDVAGRQLADVKTRIKLLQSLESELTQMIAQCRGGSVGDCQVMKVLENHEHCRSEHHARLDTSSRNIGS